MGMMHLKAAWVIVSDINAKRLENADAVGDASDAKAPVEKIRALTENRRVDCCIITSPAPQALETAAGSPTVDGRINIYTSCNDKPAPPMDMNSLRRIEALAAGSEGRSEEDFYRAARLLSFGKIDTADLAGGIYPLEEAGAAAEAALSGSTYRVLLEMGVEL
jgi:threonine dehydrogenase-like Zn-dependent dehydrogenase